MLIPSIDLMGGKIVQLVQGDRKALEFDNFEYWVERFLSYPMVQLIDLDAAMGKGSNEALVGAVLRAAAVPGRRRNPLRRGRASHASAPAPRKSSWAPRC